MNMFNVRGSVLYYGIFFHSKNHFSYDGTKLLKEIARTSQPGMELQIDEPPTTHDPSTNDPHNR